MVKRKQSVGRAPGKSDGARRATVDCPGAAPQETGALGPKQRWSAGRKREVVLRILGGESLDALSRELGVEIYRLEDWRDRALSGMDQGLKNRQGDPLQDQLNSAKRHIGELSMEIELLRERSRAAEKHLPLATRRSKR